jgi:pyruvate dehydrogenase (quinone)
MPSWIRVDSDDEVADTWREAPASDRPVLYEAVTDPEYLPLPPHISFDQAKKMAMALEGDSDRGRSSRSRSRASSRSSSTDDNPRPDYS